MRSPCAVTDRSIAGQSNRRYGAPVRRWAVGVTTAPREVPTLGRTMSSLQAAGWKEMLIFAEPNSPTHDQAAGFEVVQRARRLGAWPNWILGLWELVLRDPQADAYFMCQDDVVVCQDLREYLEWQLWPAPRSGVVSPYCPSLYSQPDGGGFIPVAAGRDAWGALTYVFSNEAAHQFLSHAFVVSYRRDERKDGTRRIDRVVGTWCQFAQRPYLVHCPSLAQHIGDTSTLYPRARNTGPRRAADFVGQHAQLPSGHARDP